jgi:hypothetical protein
VSGQQPLQLDDFNQMARLGGGGRIGSNEHGVRVCPRLTDLSSSRLTADWGASPNKAPKSHWRSDIS